MDVFTEIKNYGIAAIAKQYGYTLDKTGFSPCPACGATTRHTKRKDKRLACIIVQAGNGWVCLQCGVKGDTVDFTARTLLGGKRPTSPGEWRGVLERWTQGNGGRLPPTTVGGLYGAPAASSRPPFKDLMEFWNRSPTLPPPKVAEWLQGKYPTYQIDDVTETGCVRYLPNEEMPEWWPWKYPMMAMLAFDHHGLVQSLHARITGAVKEGTPKSRFPKGFSASGLVLANKSAVSWLRGKMEVPAVVIAEGLTSTLACTMALRKGGKWRWGVLGYTSGSASAIRQMPWDHQDVYVFTDDDKAGEDYAQKISEALPSTVVPRRAKL